MSARLSPSEQDPALHHLPPQNLEAEAALLSAILIDNTALLDILEILIPEDFYRSAHQRIFEGITDLFTTLITLGLCILIVWQSAIMAIETHQSGEVVYVIHWPLAPFQLIVPLGGVVLCLVLVMDIFHIAYTLKRRD